MASDELLGLYWTVSGPVEVHVGREWSLFDLRDRCAHAARVGFSGLGIWHADLEHMLGEGKTLAEHLLSYPKPCFVNLGTGIDVTIRELAETIRETVGYTGRLSFDATKPDGTPRKLLDVTRLKQLGWQSSITLREGLARTYRWYLDHIESVRG